MKKTYKKRFSGKGQSAVEFTILIGFSLLVLSVIIVISQNNAANQEARKNRGYTEQVMNIINQEISFAITSKPYYERLFYIPTRLNELDYELYSRDGIEIFMERNNEQYVFFLNNITLKNHEYLGLGYNIIYKKCNATECEIGLKHPYACSYLRPEGNYTIDGDAFYCSGDGHMWSATSSSTFSWSTAPPKSPPGGINCIGAGSDFPACNYCDTLVYANHNDWYLPTVQQLKGFYDRLPCNATSCGSSNLNMGWDDDADNSEYWSSDNYNNNNAYVVNMNTGANTTRNKIPPQPINLRCVRDT